MKRMTAIFGVAILAAMLLVCTACNTNTDGAGQKPKLEQQVDASGTITGLIDNHTIEILMEDGSVQSFLFFDEAVGEKLKAYDEQGVAPIDFSYAPQDGQQLMVIVSVK